MKILAIGAGHRLLDALLPMIQARPDDFEITGIYARMPRTISVREVEYMVKALPDLEEKELARADLIYCAVSPEAIPDVLEHIVRLKVFNGTLVIETPAIKVSQLNYLPLFKSFKRVICSEDMLFLPWLDTLEQWAARSAPEGPDFVELDRSGWEYHGIALIKRIFHARNALRSKSVDNSSSLVFPENRSARIVNPRDYAAGKIHIGFRGKIVSSHNKPDSHQLRGFIDDDGRSGFELDEVRTYFSEAETNIFANLPTQQGYFNIVEHMHDCKRVGFSRFFSTILTGDIPYTVSDSLDDQVICMMNAKLGRWFRSPFTSGRSAVFKALVATLCRIKYALRGF